MFDSFKKLRFEHIRKNLPLIIKTSGGSLFGGGLFIQGKGLIIVIIMSICIYI